MNIRSLLLACAVPTIIVLHPSLAQTPAAPPAAAAAPAAPTTTATPAAAAPSGNAAPASATPATPPAIVYKEGVIKVGNDMKQTLGTLIDVDKGDNGCYLTLKNEKGVEFIEVGKFELCSQKPSLKGKRVALAFSYEAIQAALCYGDPKCKRTETVPLVVGIKEVE